MVSSRQKKIWIDLDNSPHVPFFKPIMEELSKENYALTITARKCFQVCGLADLMDIKYKPIGKHYGKHKILKIIGSLVRVMQLLPIVLREKPDIAVSHGSRTQHACASLLGIPTVIIFDYEHSLGTPLINPPHIIFPEIIADSVDTSSKHQVYTYSDMVGVQDKAIKFQKYVYPGIKEDVYVPDFKPDPSIKGVLGLNDNDICAVIRPPATEAHYRDPESDVLFSTTVEILSQIQNIKMIMLPRNTKQEQYVRHEWPNLISQKKVILPEKVVDGLNLIWHSDFVISGGGTMNREAAALGVPVYSIFRGKTGAVDKHLSENGRLVMLESVDDVKTKIKAVQRNKEKNGNFEERKALKRIVSIIKEIVEKS